VEDVTVTLTDVYDRYWLFSQTAIFGFAPTGTVTFSQDVELLVSENIENGPGGWNRHYVTYRTFLGGVEYSASEFHYGEEQTYIFSDGWHRFRISNGQFLDSTAANERLAATNPQVIGSSINASLIYFGVVSDLALDDLYSFDNYGITENLGIVTTVVTLLDETPSEVSNDADEIEPEIKLTPIVEAEITNDTITVTINNTPVIFADQTPVIVENRTLVPVAGVFQALGFTVQWNEDTRQVTITRDSDIIIITINSSTFTTNSVNHQLDVPAQIIAGRTMLPIDAVLRSVGYNVNWSEETRTVAITTEAPASVNQEPIPEPVLELEEDVQEPEVEEEEQESETSASLFNTDGTIDPVTLTILEDHLRNFALGMFYDGLEDIGGPRLGWSTTISIEGLDEHIRSIISSQNFQFSSSNPLFQTYIQPVMDSYELTGHLSHSQAINNQDDAVEELMLSLVSAIATVYSLDLDIEVTDFELAIVWNPHNNEYVLGFIMLWPGF